MRAPLPQDKPSLKFPSSRDRPAPRRPALKIKTSATSFTTSESTDSFPSTPSTPGRRVRWSAALEQHSPPPKSWDDGHSWAVSAELKDRLYRVQAEGRDLDSLPRLKKKASGGSQWAFGTSSATYERPADFVPTWTPFNPFAKSGSASPAPLSSSQLSPSAGWAAQLGNDWNSGIQFDYNAHSSWNNSSDSAAFF